MTYKFNKISTGLAYHSFPAHNFANIRLINQGYSKYQDDNIERWKNWMHSSHIIWYI
jgi:hypothetical protein